MLFKIYLYLISLQKDVTKNALSTPEEYSFITHKSKPGLDKKKQQHIFAN